MFHMVRVVQDWLRHQMGCTPWRLRCGSVSGFDAAAYASRGACRAGSGATPLLRENATLLQAYVSVQLLVAVLVRPCSRDARRGAWVGLTSTNYVAGGAHHGAAGVPLSVLWPTTLQANGGWRVEAARQTEWVRSKGVHRYIAYMLHESNAARAQRRRG